MSDRITIEPGGGDLSAPHRVLRTVRAEQAASEWMISWIELAIVLTFSGLYAIAPRTAPVASLNPVPWILLGYLLVVGLRLWFSYRGWLPPWILTLSAIVDIALLMALIWSFHVQYAQPAGFYLKAPTWAYVFIFITLRALRFEPRYVIVAGTSAMIGWAVLVGYALLAVPGAPVTRDYLAYMSGPLVLLGAEFDKLITIAVVTVILALALDRVRRLVIRAASDAEAARDLKRFFAPEAASRITSAAQPLQPGQGEIRTATVLQIDIKGFTTYAAMFPPDRVIALLTAYQGLVAPIVRRHGGSIDKFIGDGVMVTFGAFLPRPTHAADAIRAALEVVAAVRAWKQEATPEARGVRQLPLEPAPAGLEIGVAVAHGEVVVGAIGEPDRLDYTVVGNPVNLAAKLEKHTRIERVEGLAWLATYRLAGEQGLAQSADPAVLRRAIAGLSDPVDLVVLA